MIKVPKSVEENLFRMRLRRKYSAVLLGDNEVNQKNLKKVRNYVAYGKINEKMLEKLINVRGQQIGKNKENKINTKKIILEIEKKRLQDLGLKAFFRLHPPRGGIKSKKHFGVGKGVLGDNKDKINNLLERML